MKHPLISVIIVNYNGKHYLNENLSSLEKQTYPHVEIIMVDNGSSDGSVEFIRTVFPDVRIIQNNVNLGFTANNQGMRIAKGKYIFLLNNDTVVEPDLLMELWEHAQRDKTIGMCSPKILIINNPKLIDAVGINICIDGMSRQKGRLQEDSEYQTIEEILLPSGCAAFYKREMLDEIGLFDEDFFAYCEDTDLGFRGRLAGWKAIFVPSARVYHHGSGSAGKSSPLKAFLVERNHLWFVIKCFPLSMLLMLPFYSLYRYTFQIYAVLTGQGIGGKFAKEQSKGNLALILIRAYWSAFSKLPSMLKKRKEIQQKRKVSNSEIKSWFKRYKLTIKDLVLTG